MKILVGILGLTFLLLLVAAFRKTKFGRPVDRAEEKKKLDADKKDRADKKETEKKPVEGWKRWVGPAITVGVAMAVLAIAVYSLTREENVSPAWSNPAPSSASMAATLRNAIELPFDTSFLFTAKTARTHFVPGTGCKEWVRKVKHTHSFILENQNGRFEVLPGREVSVGDSEWFALSAFGGPEAEVRIILSGCDSSKAKSPTSRGS